MNFSGTENLLAFKGAKLMTGLDDDHPQCLYVCIPVPYNDIQVSRDGRYANAAVYMQETNDKFRQACIQRRQQAGDPMDGYTPPSHQMEVSFSKDFRQRALEAARRRLVQEHPEWQSSEDLCNPEHNAELKNAMYNAVRLRLGSMYARIRPSQSGQPQYGQTQYGQPAAQAQQWMPETGGDYMGGMGYNDTNLPDLPF